MSPEDTASTHYQCFDKSIQLYQFFGFFTEVRPTTWLRRLICFLPWGAWYWFTSSLGLNVALLVTNYLRHPNFDVRGTEIFQRAFEACLAPLFLFEMHFFINRYYPMVTEMRRTYDTDPDVFRTCKFQEKRILVFSFIILAATMFCAYYQKLFFGLPPKEVELVAYYYHKALPERQLPFIMWFPFDDTLNPGYYLALVLNIYLLQLTFVLAFNTISCTLIFAVHLRGQYLILAKYLHNIGNPHVFVYKNPCLSKSSLEATTSTMNSSCSSTSETGADYEHVAYINLAREMGRNFERDCLVFIIRRHQYLIDYRRRLQAMFKIMTVSKLLAYIVVSFSLYQLSFVTKFDIYAFQLILQLLVALSFTFAVTHSSEILDEGNQELRWAAYTNPWTRGLRFERKREKRGSSAHARMLLVLMCMFERPVRFNYYGGSLTLCYSSFLMAMRLCYSLFTFMKRSIHVKY